MREKPVFSEESTEKVLREFAAEKNVKAGVLINGSASRAHRTGRRSELVRSDGEPGTRADSGSAEEGTA